MGYAYSSPPGQLDAKVLQFLQRAVSAGVPMALLNPAHAGYPAQWVAAYRKAPPIKPYWFAAVFQNAQGNASQCTFQVHGNFASNDFWVFDADTGARISGGNLPLSTQPGSRLWLRLTSTPNQTFDAFFYRQ